VHDAPAPHEVVAGASAQAPAPLHAPVLPHGGAAGHCPDGAVVPTGTFVHVPTLPFTLQARQVPQGPALQHTPSVQKPLPHSWFEPQLAPSIRFAAQLPGAAALPVQ